MNNNLVLCTSIMIFLCLCTACGSSEQPKQASLLPQQAYGDSLKTEAQREQLQQFIVNNLSGAHGVFTNFLDTDQSTSLATGHEVLSESAGLLMRYYAITGQKGPFDNLWARTKQIFNLSSSFSYRYSPELPKLYSLNAAVDDLRIIRALHEAGSVFKEESYVEEAEAFGLRFYKYNVKDGYLYDFYDDAYQITNDFITLCYIDLKTLRLLPINSDNHRKLERNMLKIIKEGYLSNDFPFYETRYQYKDDSYTSDNINAIESLLTILVLSEIGEQHPESIRYLKEQVKHGALYGQYSKEGVPTTEIQSTAIYAITAMIGSQLGDKALYEDSITRMNEFQVQDQGSPLHGGFGNPESQQAYSFDNLMALLAYAY
jgi:uncharacterized protein YkuJ